uniref:Uncharacterized protein n=1 Tax=Romanomermis culicivorax TaxID=13658 RepID=A0A915KW06_ROMCU
MLNVFELENASVIIGIFCRKKRQCLFFTQSTVIWENNPIFVFRVPELEENDATETKEAGST